MHDYFHELALRQGFIARSDVLSVGEDDRFIRRMMQGRVWTRIRNGSYSPISIWEPLDELARHDRRARAVLHAHGDAVALSHVSALVVRGSCDIWGIDLSRVHVTRRDGRSGSLERDVVHHQGVLCDDDIDVVDGLFVVEENRCFAETIASTGVEQGLVALDSGLRSGRASEPPLHELRAAMRRHTGSRALDLALRLADRRAESVGESRSRYLFWRQGLPKPEVQYPVLDHDGVLVGTADLALPEHRLLFEFDGRVKYGRLLAPGQEPGDAVFAEKLREDALRRACGFAVERATWADLAQPRATARRIRLRMSGESVG